MRQAFIFRNLTPAAQLFLLIILVLLFAILSIAAAYITSVFFWGPGILESAADVSVSNLNFLRLFQISNQIGIFLIPPLLLALISESKPVDFLGFRKPRLTHMAAAFVFILSIAPFINLLAEWNEALVLPQIMEPLADWMRAQEEKAALLTNRFLEAGGWKTLLINTVMIALLPALGEELLFRSALIGILKKFFRSIHWPVLISAVIFSAFHLQFFGFLPRFALGAGLGYLFVWSGSLWVPVLAHFVNNFMVVLVAYLYQQNLIDTGVEEFGKTGSPLLLTAAVVLPALALFGVFRSRRQTGGEETQ